MQAFRRVLGGPDWNERLRALSGYQADMPGQVLRLTEALPWWAEIVGPRSTGTDADATRGREKEA